MSLLSLLVDRLFDCLISHCLAVGTPPEQTASGQQSVHHMAGEEKRTQRQKVNLRLALVSSKLIILLSDVYYF